MLFNHSPISIGIASSDNSLHAVILDKNKKALLHACYHWQGSIEEYSMQGNALVTLFTNLPSVIRSNIVAVSINHTPESSLVNEKHRRTHGFNRKKHRFTINECAKIQSSHLLDQNTLILSKENFLCILRSSHNKEFFYHLKEYQLRQKSDWLMGWFLGNVRWVEESNNLNLGWSINEKAWIKESRDTVWIQNLGDVVSSGSVMGSMSTDRASMLGLLDGCLIVSSTNNDTAATAVVGMNNTDSILALNNQLSFNCFVQIPLINYGITNYRIGRQWIAQGLSRTGTAILKYIFSYHVIHNLCYQINPKIPSGLCYYPLVNTGEKFPIDHIELRPLIEPRPTSDSLYLHGLLEGLARIEYMGLKKMEKLSSNTIERIITIGHGAHNPQWRLLRQRISNIEIQNQPNIIPATGLALLALNGFYRSLDM